MRRVWGVITTSVNVAYKAAMLYLAYLFVSSTIDIYRFIVQIGMAFFRLQNDIPV